MLSVLDRDDTERLYKMVKTQLKQWEGVSCALGFPHGTATLATLTVCRRPS
jgi:hypothetical protein